MFPNYVIWLIVCGCAITIEAFTDGLVSIWFAVGAFVTALVSAFVEPGYWIELFVFAAISLAFLGGFLLFRKRYPEHHDNTVLGLDAVVGHYGVIVVPTGPNTVGRVRVDGVDYPATSAKAVLLQSDKVVVKDVDGMRLRVEPIQTETKPEV